MSRFVRLGVPLPFEPVRAMGSRVADLVGRTPLLRLDRLAAALAVGREAPGSTIVTILPDSGARYVSERFWTEADEAEETSRG